MTVKLTKRDKLLLYLLVIVLIAFGFTWLVVLPQLDRSAELDLKIGELEAEKMPMEAAVKAVDSMRGLCEENRNTLEEELREFYPYLENYEIDKMVTTLMTETYGLTVSSLSMEDTPAGVPVPAYHAAGQEAGEEGEGAEPDGEAVSVLTSSVSVSAEGDRSRMQALIDDLFYNYPSLRVTGYSIAGEGEDATLALQFDLYMRTK